MRGGHGGLGSILERLRVVFNLFILLGIKFRDRDRRVTFHKQYDSKHTSSLFPLRLSDY